MPVFTKQDIRKAPAWERKKIGKQSKAVLARKLKNVEIEMSMVEQKVAGDLAVSPEYEERLEGREELDKEVRTYYSWRDGQGWIIFWLHGSLLDVLDILHDIALIKNEIIIIIKI